MLVSGEASGGDRRFPRAFRAESVASPAACLAFYRGAGPDGIAEIGFTYDYLNSCLHEAAHWCIAGKDRRLQDDYGYWYRPDGRNGSEQEEFFRAEVAPLALEWAFATASGEPFRVSLDNLVGTVGP